MTRLRASETRYKRPDGVDPSSVVSVFRVPPELAGQRLDLFVQGQLHRTSRTRTQEIIERSAYDAEGRRLRANDRVKTEQLVLLWRAPWDEVPVRTDIGILYEDEHLLAVDKPPLLPVHPTARYYRNTLIRLLHDARPGAFLALGHRLDRETSGVLLVAKTLESERALKRALEARVGIRKTYLAITWGVPRGARETGRFRYECGLELDADSPLRVKMRVGDGSAAVHAATVFEVIAETEVGGKTYAQVQCNLETGRQHQIRVHLAALGAPVVGDKLYGPDDLLFARAADGALTAEDHATLELPRHALHAAELALAHPVTGTPLAIVSPLPKDLREFWTRITSHEESCRDRPGPEQPE